ncbi:MAG TPA: O-antigen ligase family protein [Baekduia sp.]|nr:O-antigen ligase family protein [Baekduia sp.]
MSAVAARLRAAPTTVPALVAVALLLVWIPLDGGQAITRWAPGALLLIALLAVCVIALPPQWGSLPGAVRAAVVLLAAFTAWSFASIAWADDQGIALEGADRTLLYLVAFALLALWPQRPGTAGWIAGAWTGGVGVLAVVTLLHAGAVGDPRGLFHEDRLLWPAGYPNAAAATWLMALWPAVCLAASSRVPWALRGLLAAAAVVLVDVAMLSLSRGALLSLPVCALLLVVLVPGRLRTIAVLLVVAGASAAALPAVLDVGTAITGGSVPRMRDALDAAERATLLAAVAAGLVVGAASLLEARRPPSRRTVAAIRRVWGGIVVLGAAAGLVAALVVAGNPVHRAQDAWDSFKGGYADNASGNRLTSGLGSNRYDFFRVALDEFRDHPVAGVGVDNFGQDYLARGRSYETPAYPHDLALRTLAQTGLVGALLLAGAFGAALAAGWRAMRTDRLAAAVAGGAVVAFSYWVVHGMTDWFWEWAGLGAPAFVLLGLACGLAPRARRAPGHDDPPAAAIAAVDPGEPGEPAPVLPRMAGGGPEADAEASPRRRMPAVVPAVITGVVAVAGALAIAGPWLAEREMEHAAAIFDEQPLAAYERLDRAARLDPLSDRPALLEGSIAVRYGDLPRAEAAFRDALSDSPRDQYATLELGAIQSARGARGAAVATLRRAVALAPRDDLAREALKVVRSGGAIDLAELNRRILASAQRLRRG